MSENALTILAIFAHPDDEIGAGSTLARYGDAGVRTVLACATRGEAATIFCEDCATRETLAEVRTQELECACRHLGISELRWLDWPDGGIKNLPRDRAIGQIVRLIREVRPFVIITHPAHGLYPHPDHLALYEIVLAAWSASIDLTQYPGNSLPWGAARLFTRAMPQSLFERAPGLSEFRVELNGELLPFMGTPDDEIDVAMRVEQWVERRMAAWDCHRSQHNPKGFSSIMPDGLRREMAANEHYLLAASRFPLPKGVKDDLLAGLWREAPQPQSLQAPHAAAPESLATAATEALDPGSPDPGSPDVAGPPVALATAATGSKRAGVTPAPRGQRQRREAPAIQPAEAPAAAEQGPSPGDLRAMEGELAAHLAFAEVLRSYVHDPSEVKTLQAYRQLADGEQEIIYRLARAIRQAGGSPGAVTADGRLADAGKRRERTDVRHTFLREQFTAARGRIQARASAAAAQEDRELWEELAVMARAQLDGLSV